MSKRLNDDEDEKRKKRKHRFRIENAPEIKTLKDLINAGKQYTIYKNIDGYMLWKICPYLEQLDKLIGMKSLKESIFYQVLYYIQGMHVRNQSEEYLHTILLGAPGIGKTTVANIIAKIYQGLGILSPEGPFKIARRDDFIAGYLGQTAIKTQKLLTSCLGGVLFIDEVYSLGAGSDSGKDSFSKEAIDTLCGFLSEHTNDFCCIAAGYEKDIQQCFFSVNSGLESRFQWKHYIEEYSSEELAEIYIKKVKDIKWELGVDKKAITCVIEKRKDLFVNSGRDIVNLISKCKMAHSRRVLGLDNDLKFILTKEDVIEGLEMMKKTKINDKNQTNPPLGMYM